MSTPYRSHWKQSVAFLPFYKLPLTFTRLFRYNPPQKGVILLKKATSVLLSLALVGTVSVPAALAAGLDHFEPQFPYEEGRFLDVAAKDWFSPSVSAVYELGLMKGTGPDTFAPSSKVDLASAVALTARLHAIYHGGDLSGFDQSAGQNWYETYIEYAVENNFLDREAWHDYEKPITRQEFAALLHTALPEEAFEAVNEIGDGEIPDVEMDADYADAIYALYRAGILTGSGEDNEFLPGDHITRAELAAVTSRTADPELRCELTFGEAPDEDEPGSGGGSGTQPPAETPAPSQSPPAESPAPSATPTPSVTPTPSATPTPSVTPTPPAQEPPAEESPAPEQPAPSSEAEQVLNLVNAARAQNGLSPMTLDTEMTAAANTRAKETVSQFSHTRPDGSSFSTALTQAGVSYRSYGENIAWGQRSAQSVMDTWMNSSGHRANILGSYSRLGVGVYRTADGTPYWVQLFCD